MRAVILLAIVAVLIFLGFCLWQLIGAMERKRKDDRDREREREEWADDMLKGDD